MPVIRVYIGGLFPRANYDWNHECQPADNPCITLGPKSIEQQKHYNTAGESKGEMAGVIYPWRLPAYPTIDLLLYVHTYSSPYAIAM